MPDNLMNQLQHSLVNIFSDSPLVTLEQNVDRALETITMQLQCDGVFVISGNQKVNRPKARNLYLKPQFNKGYGARDWPLEKLPFFRSLIRQPRLVKLHDINELPKTATSEKALLKQWDVKSLLVMPPVAFGQTRIAVGAVSCGQKKPWQDEVINELANAAALIGAAMELTRIAQALLHSEHKYQELFLQLPLACSLVDSNNQLTMLNSIAELCLDASEGNDLVAMVREEERPVLLETLAVVREDILSQAWCEVPLYANSKFNWLKLSFSKMRGDEDKLVMMAEDVNENHRLADELSFHANYDTLTGLPNRLHFEALLNKALSLEAEPAPTCVAFLDLDQFQVINNVSGHKAGDRLLCQIAQRLKQLVRKGDIVARLGGDEFGILMRYSSLESAEVIA